MSFCHDVSIMDSIIFITFMKFLGGFEQMSWWQIIVNFMDKTEFKISLSLYFPYMILFLITHGLISFNTHSPALEQHEK